MYGCICMNICKGYLNMMQPLACFVSFPDPSYYASWQYCGKAVALYNHFPAFLYTRKAETRLDRKTILIWRQSEHQDSGVILP